jgi:hypothetical protein
VVVQCGLVLGERAMLLLNNVSCYLFVLFIYLLILANGAVVSCDGNGRKLTNATSIGQSNNNNVPATRKHTTATCGTRLAVCFVVLLLFIYV